MERFPDGTVYEGDWVDGKRHGTGTYTYGEDGDTDEGLEWVKPGDKYTGTWVENKFDGIGQWTHAKDGKAERIEAKMEKDIRWPDRD